MRPLIPPRYYFDEDVFQEEQRTVFARVWQLAGFTSDLRNENDYVTAEVGGKSVVVQNFDGELHAFANVCSHRFARLRSEPKGNAWLRCPYHGWIYNKEGIPYSIPARPRFDDLCPEVIQGLALKRYDVESCGGLVFVREQTGGPSLREFLGESWELLESMSLALGEEVYHIEILFRCNWKVAIENGLESYHVGFVHQDTFKTLGTSGMDFRFGGDHSAWYTGVVDATRKQMSKMAKLGKMPFPIDGYVHQLVFPNVTVSSVGGTAFGFQFLRPLSATETMLTGIVFLSKMGADENVQAMVKEILGPSSGDFTLQVAHEDRGVCEAVQLGAPEAEGQPGILSDEEERVYKFQEAYMAHMGGALSAADAASLVPSIPV